MPAVRAGHRGEEDRVSIAVVAATLAGFVGGVWATAAVLAAYVWWEGRKWR